MVGSNTQIINISNKILAPGYIEPHGHPFQLYNPMSYAKHVLKHGTTCSINDNWMFIRNMKIDDFINMIELLSSLPIKMLWSARLDPQTFANNEEKNKFAYDVIRRLINHPLFLQVGEITDWPSLLAGDKNLQRLMVDAQISGKKAEGHAPAASINTLNALAAAGITSCHEAISAEEIQHRIEVGLYSILRNSSLRPDLPSIIQGLLKYDHISWERMMMTTDCPSPAYMKWGAADHLIRIAIKNGVNPVTAYQLVTRNPAVYFGLDSEIGGIAPGRLADLLILEDLEEPTPLKVYADGKLVVDNIQQKVRDFPPPLDWSKLGLRPIAPPLHQLQPKDMLPLYEGNDSFPVIELINPVISKRKDLLIGTEGLIRNGDYLELSPDSHLCYAVLITRNHTFITHGIISKFAKQLDALASSYTGSLDLLVIGQNPAAMTRALHRIEEIGGGIVMVLNGEFVFEFSLPLEGVMSDEEMPRLIQEISNLEELLRQTGHPHYDPIYTLLFLSSTHLPAIRLTRRGLISVKDRRILRPSKPLLN